MLYLYREFTFTSSRYAPEDKNGKIVDIVAPADQKDNLHFKYYNPHEVRREKNFKYISCRELLRKDAVKWDVRDLTGKSLIGRRVQSCFQLGADHYWYDGRVTDYDASDSKYSIRYCDDEIRKVSIKDLLPMLRRGKVNF